MPQKKLTVEVYSDTLNAAGKRTLVHRYTTTEYADLDDALEKARRRAETDGRKVLSANYRADKSGQSTDAIVVYVKER